MKKRLLSILAGLGFATAIAITSVQANSAGYLQRYMQKEEVVVQNQPRTWKELEEVVLEKSLENKVIMFGEQHEAYWHDNDFVIKIISKLKAQGYEYFALEIDRNPSEKNLSNNIKKMFEEYESGKFTIKEIKKRYKPKLTEKEVTDLSDEFRKILTDYANGKITKKESKKLEHIKLWGYAGEYYDIKRENIHPIWIDNEKEVATKWFDLIDAVREAGMKIVCYAPNIPNDCTSWNEREEKMFSNLKELIFDKDPNAKVVIYCGLMHLSEKPTTLADYSRRYPEIREGEEQLGLKKNEDGRYECLGAYMNEHTEDKTLTVSLVPSYMPPYCDLIMDFTGRRKIKQNKLQKELEEIVLSNSKNNKVVMFGEDHKKYRLDNDFVAEILPKLKKQGFQYLALEFDRKPSEQNSLRKILEDYAKGKVTREKIDQTWIDEEEYEATGWFDFIDSSRKSGMKIVCYDAEKESEFWNDREKKAFNNLRELIFDKDKDAKVVVYCGSLHLNEKPTHKLHRINIGFENKDEIYECLAFHINNYTKGETLTVSLTSLLKPFYCDIVIDLKNSKYEIYDNNLSKGNE